MSTACYVARIRGVRSAMPMFQALKLCPDAVVIKPRMQVYVEVSRQIRTMMEELTPAIQPLSLDEAFMDLSGTARLHGAPPAVMLARLVKRMQEELGVTGSIGLSHNKFLAKVASDLEKPRGFSVIGKAETADFLHDKPVRMIWGSARRRRAPWTGPAFAPLPICCVGTVTICSNASARWAIACIIWRGGKTGGR